jgi:hypothetical protein
MYANSWGKPAMAVYDSTQPQSRPQPQVKVRDITQQLQGNRHMTGFHACQAFAVQGQAALVYEGSTKAGTGSQHDHRPLAAAPDLPGLCHAAVVAVVAYGYLDWPACHR